MKTLIVALMVSLAAPAFATPDMGTKATVKQECNGVTLTVTEAQGFVVNFNVLIMLASQVVPMDEIASTDQQLRMVAILKKMDAIAGSDKAGCIVAPPDDVKLLVDTGAKMIDIEMKAGAAPMHVEFVLRLAKGDKKVARGWALGLSSAAHKLGAYGDSIGTSL